VRLSGCLAGLTVAVALLAAPGGAGAAIVNNGDFETGNLSGWQLSTTAPGEGWFAYSGTSSPLNDFSIPAPPQGNHAAITDEEGEGLHVLYQDMTLPPGGSVNQLSLFVYYDTAAPIDSPNSLDPMGGANQQYRIDVMKPSAPIDSVAAGDVLLTVFRTLAGDPQSLGPTVKTADLTAFAGQTIRLRLAEVDNQFFFNAGADAISINSNGFTIGAATRNKKKGTAQLPVTVPDAGTLTLSGKGVKGSSAAASKSVAVQGGTTNLVVKAKGKKAKKLKRKGKVKVNVTVTYAPSGLAGSSQTEKLKLKKKT
jgi:hypothetical protein